MKTPIQPASSILQAACATCLLLAMTSCEMPPREAWRIIQRDGLFTYMDREYNPSILPSRYLTSNGRPFVPARSSQVPYRPGYHQSRYLASTSTVPYRTRPRPEPQRYSRPKPAPAPESKILLEPSKTASSTPRSSPKPPPASAPAPSMDSLPYGTPVPGRPGMVNSPFATQQQLVDVTGMAAGEAVKDPYSGKLFRVPPTQQAAAEPAESSPPPPPAPAEEPKVQP
ncbi:hypothetical protein EI77_01416 [Prosthecobacter fusiformis]|uniref:Uncharacterized protein n=1 Tax=Prosthecobacter fusiformis TaxID=48464 RepID=A0A4R7S3I4_9BACT|nr:hypothetical protein [Prosthecobacter fusiformis]TDU72950.1 hypothetical protein EI77_01416 [Prosthecobacter fusiformis]